MVLLDELIGSGLGAVCSALVIFEHDLDHVDLTIDGDAAMFVDVLLGQVGTTGSQFEVIG